MQPHDSTFQGFRCQVTEGAAKGWLLVGLAEMYWKGKGGPATDLGREAPDAGTASGGYDCRYLM